MPTGKREHLHHAAQQRCRASYPVPAIQQWRRGRRAIRSATGDTTNPGSSVSQTAALAANQRDLGPPHPVAQGEARDRWGPSRSFFLVAPAASVSLALEKGMAWYSESGQLCSN